MRTEVNADPGSLARVNPGGIVNEASTAVKSADRALIVLEHLAAARSPRSLAEIADALDIPRSSLHGLLRTMAGRGWLAVEDADAGVRYRIGAQALTVGASFLLSDDIVTRSAALLDQISLDLGETIHLGVLEGPEVVYLAKRDARHNLRLVSGVGVRLPAYATALGKVLMAELTEAALAPRLTGPRRKLTANTLVEEVDLLADLADTRARGYAIDDQESTEGVRCFAVALGTTTPRTHAISCSTPVARLDSRLERRIVDLLMRAADSFQEPAGIGIVSR